MFNQLKKMREPMEMFSSEIYLDTEPPSASEIEERQNTIELLVRKRYEDEDNNYLQITEMNGFEKQLVYSDTLPLLKVRMKVRWTMK